MDIVLFVNPSILKEICLDNNIDEKMLRNTIKDVQDIELEPIIGTSMYESLISKISSNTLNDNEKYLIKNKIFNVILAGVNYRLSDNLMFRYANSGVLKDSNANSVVLSTDELRILNNNKKEILTHHRKRLIDYLVVNSVKFPDYNKISLEGVGPVSEQSGSVFFFDDDEFD